MAGPVIEALKDRLGVEDEATVRERLEESPVLEKQRQRLQDKMGDGAGGCCNAAMAAKATRREGKEFR